MPLLSRRAMWLFVFVVVALAVAGISREASAQVYQGAVTSPEFPGIAISITVTLHPGGAATYTLSYFGAQIDSGILIANVAGSSVNGFIQSSDPTVGPCFFAGTVNGGGATLTMDPATCGGQGNITLTRVA